MIFTKKVITVLNLFLITFYCIGTSNSAFKNQDNNSSHSFVLAEKQVLISVNDSAICTVPVSVISVIESCSCSNLNGNCKRNLFNYLFNYPKINSSAVLFKSYSQKVSNNCPFPLLYISHRQLLI